MRRLKTFIKYAFLLCLLIAALLSWIITTETGLQWSWQRIQTYMPKELSINQIDGRISGQIFIGQLKWQDSTNNIEISNLSLKCNWLGLIFTKLSCDKVEIQRISHTLKSSIEAEAISRESNKKNFALPSIELPMAISIAALKLKEFQHFSIDTSHVSEQNNTPLVTISKLSLTKLQGHSSLVSFKGLKFYHPDSQSNVDIGAQIDFKQQWQHQLKLSISSANLNANFESKGKIDASSVSPDLTNSNSNKPLQKVASTNNNFAKFRLISTTPYQSEASGHWYWNNGLVIKQGNIQSAKQTVLLAEEKISINQMNSQFSLTWPKLALDSQLNFDWQGLNNIELNTKLTASDIVNWQQNSQVVLSMSSEIESDAIQQLENRFLQDDSSFKNKLGLAEKKSSKPVSTAVSGVISLAIEQGKLTLTSDKIKIADATLRFKAESTLGKKITENLKFEGELTAETLKGLLNYPIESLNANWRIQKENHVWSLFTQGKLASLQHPEVNVKGLQWDVKLDQQWSGNIKAHSVVANSLKQLPNDKPMMITAPSIKLIGTAEDHRLDALFSVEKSKPTSLKIAGRLAQDKHLKTEIKNNQINAPTEPTTYWHISNMQASIPFAERLYQINAENLKLSSKFQKFESFCIQESGKICVSGFKNNSEWSAKINSSEISLQSLSLLAENFAVKTPFNIEGKITGFAELSGTNDQLNQMQTNLNSPQIKIRNDLTQLNWDNFSLKSGKSNGHYALNINWRNAHVFYTTPDWQSELKTPSGIMQLNVSPNWDLNFLLTQEDILWAPPYSPANSDLFSFVIPEVTLEGKITAKNLDSKLKLRLPEKDYINASFKSSWPLAENNVISGELDLLVSKLDWLKKWQTRIDQLDAYWQQKLVISGTLDKPRVVGTGVVEIANLEIEEIGVDIRDSQFNLSIIDEKLNLIGKLINKQGELHLTGDANLYPNLSARLKMTGKNLILLNEKENKVVITPNIMANFQQNELDIKGEIIIDEAKLKISALPKQAVTVSDDQIIIESRQKPQSPFKYRINLDMKTGELVYVSGFGLTSEVKGHLKTAAISGEPIALNGRLSLVGGQFEAFKQKLTIEEGELLFLGSADNPGIQFKAVRKLDEIKVGVIANGSIASPRLTLYSQPAMSEENILALLLTGKTIEALSPKEGSALANAAISLGIEGANKLAQKIGAALGIKNLAVSSKIAADSTRVDIGAQINSQLSVGYGAIIDSKNEMSSGWIIEYQLSKNVSIEAISGETMNASISYKKQIAGEPSTNKKKDEKNKLDQKIIKDEQKAKDEQYNLDE